MNSTLLFILLLYGTAQLIITSICFLMYVDYGSDINWKPILFPSEWYRESRLNWFGAIIASAYGFVFAPIVYICRIIYWLCHIGRK